MCDEAKLAEWAASGVSRRGFGALGLAGAAAACTTPMGVEDGQAISLTERSVGFRTPDGAMDGFFVHPASGKSPGVILWPDIAGLREAKRQMARRLARSGYAVLLVNPYYRDVSGEQFADFAGFSGAGGFQKVGPWRSRLTAEPIMRDAKAIAAWLDQQDAVDTARGIGTQGYCMGGPFTVWSAAALPGRVRGAASFHGGGLVKPGDPMSPHELFDTSRASHLIAIAQDDDAKAPGDKDALRAAATAAGRPAEITVYPADHGWCVPDSPSYNAVEADRAWERLLALYATM